MTARGDIERFQHAVATGLGLNFEADRYAFLGEVLKERVGSTGGDAEAYLRRLEGDAPAEELKALIQPLTVNETFFFRNLNQLRAFSEVVLPSRLRARAGVRRLKLLSAGCASGEEPYTLGMLTRALPETHGWEVSVTGVDINPEVLKKAAGARYSAWSLRDTTPELRERWFRPEGKQFVVDPSIQALTRFEERNLAEPQPTLWVAESYDVVFCRNILMYLTPKVATEVVARIAKSLLPGGFLVLGHAETLRGLSQGFHLRHTHDTFYYQRRDGADDPPLVPAPYFNVPPPDAPANDSGWVENIRRASERIASLPTPPPPPDAGWDLDQALELLKQERFEAARELLNRLPPAAQQDREVLLLSAVLFTHGAQLARAEEVCGQLLELDASSAGAHFLIGLCREERGDKAEAIEHHSMAAYLDPSFSMPALHLGRLARKARSFADARLQLGKAMLLLQREDAARLLLFGGGFSKDALLALCRL